MKTTITTLFFVLALCSNGTAQEWKNNIKINPALSAYERYEIGYERRLTPTLSLETNLIWISSKSYDKSLRTGSTTDPDQFNILRFLYNSSETYVRVNSGKKGWSWELGPRFYMLRRNARNLMGGFVQPELLVTRYQFDQYRIVQEDLDQAPFTETTSFEEINMKSWGGKVNLGIQYIFFERLSFELAMHVGYQWLSEKAEEGIRYSGDDGMYEPGECSIICFPDFKDAVYGENLVGMNIKLGVVF